MCIILFAWRYDPRFRLVAAANRDELHARPTEGARFWSDDPSILAGRDLESGGTWMGITPNGRFAAVTNYRDPKRPQRGETSRGELVADFLRSTATVRSYVQDVLARGGSFGGFGLLVSDGDDLAWVSNRSSAPIVLEPGLYGLSNHLLETPWPKVRRGKLGVEEALRSRSGDEAIVDGLLEMLADRSIAPDESLPDTGVGLDFERRLSPIFIADPTYGTRASTVLLMKPDAALFVERTFDSGVRVTGQQRFELAIER
jgi:uncharacterized protein with NRDE domain